MLVTLGVWRHGYMRTAVVYDPQHPLADEEGLVRYPSVDMADQMTSLIIAQRAYEANAKTFETARDAYRRALTIGKG